MGKTNNLFSYLMPVKLLMLLGILWLVFPVGPAYGQLANSPWPMFHHDLQHTGRSSYNGPEEPEQRWTFETGYQMFGASPAIGADGTIYMGSCDHTFYAINPDGTLKWEYTTGESIESSPAIGTDGNIYIGSKDGKLYAFDTEGTFLWEFVTENTIESSPAIASDGTIYVGSNDGKLYAIHPNGTLKWDFSTGNDVASSPAIGSDGTIYVGNRGHKLFAIYSNGELKWEYETDLWIDSSPAIGTDGTIYVGSTDNKLYAIFPDGTIKWEFITGDEVRSSPAIGEDGTIYVGSNDDKLYAVNPDGSLKWDFDTGHDVVSSPAIGADGTIYVGSLNSHFYAFDPNGTLKWDFGLESSTWSSSAIGTDTTIYIGSKDGKLFAIGPKPEPKPAVTLSSLSLDFGSVPIDNNPEQTVTLTNSGDADLTIDSIGISGENAGEFTVDDGDKSTLTPGENVIIGVRFEPRSEGNKSAYLEITTNAEGSPHRVNLTGRGILPGICWISPLTLDFGSVILSTHSDKTVTLKNNGLPELEITNMEIIGDNSGVFSITDGDTTITLMPSDSLLVTVRFAPQSVNSETAFLIVTSDAPTSPDTVGLTGKGTKDPLADGNLSGYVSDMIANPINQVNVRVEDANNPGLPLAGTQTDANGYYELSIRTTVKQEPKNVLQVYSLFQNFPNPFNPSTKIIYSLKKKCQVTIKVHNILGQLVETLVDEQQPPGKYFVNWGGDNHQGMPTAAGIYFYTLKTDEFVKTKKMVKLDGVVTIAPRDFTNNPLRKPITGRSTIDPVASAAYMYTGRLVNIVFSADEAEEKIVENFTIAKGEQQLDVQLNRLPIIDFPETIEFFPEEANRAIDITEANIYDPDATNPGPPLSTLNVSVRESDCLEVYLDHENSKLVATLTKNFIGGQKFELEVSEKGNHPKVRGVLPINIIGSCFSPTVVHWETKEEITDTLYFELTNLTDMLLAGENTNAPPFKYTFTRTSPEDMFYVKPGRYDCILRDEVENFNYWPPQPLQDTFYVREYLKIGNWYDKTLFDLDLTGDLDVATHLIHEEINLNAEHFGDVLSEFDLLAFQWVAYLYMFYDALYTPPEERTWPEIYFNDDYNTGLLIPEKIRTQPPTHFAVNFLEDKINVNLGDPTQDVLPFRNETDNIHASEFYLQTIREVFAEVDPTEKYFRMEGPGFVPCISFRYGTWGTISLKQWNWEELVNENNEIEHVIINIDGDLLQEYYHYPPSIEAKEALRKRLVSRFMKLVGMNGLFRRWPKFECAYVDWWPGLPEKYRYIRPLVFRAEIPPDDSWDNKLTPYFDPRDIQNIRYYLEYAGKEDFSTNLID